MRILHTESSCGWGGQEIRILSESQGMIRRGHEVHIVCPPEAILAREAARFGVPLTPLAIDRKRREPLMAMRRFLRQHPFDIVNTHSSTDSWLVAVASLLLRGRAPVVRTRHISTPLTGRFTRRWLYMHAAARVVTTGQALRRSLITDYGFDGARIVSIPTGIDLDRFSPGDQAAARAALGLPQDRPILGIVATLRRAKGHHLLLPALARLRPADTLLLVIGDGPNLETLQALAASLQLRERVQFVGNQDDVLPWLRALDVFVLPTLHEGIPQSLAQAMAVGLCCVTTPVGGIPEIATDEESALFFPPDDTAAIVLALERVLADKALRARLGTAARVAALERCSIEHMLDRMEALFETVIAEHAARSHR